MSETRKTTATISIGGKEKTIKKLRAGKFYEAQKVIAQIFKSATEISAGDKKTGIKGVDSASLVGVFEKFPQQIVKFVAICSGLEEKEILKDAYPEEINEAFGTCLELNNVMENLKNSVAPIGRLGGK